HHRRIDRDQHRRGPRGLCQGAAGGALMAMNSQGRPTTPGAAGPAASGIETFTGHRGLDYEELLIFESGSLSKSGVDLPEPKPVKSRLNGLERNGPIGLPGLTEPEAMRHYVRLSQRNYAIDTGLYPLGS